MKYHVSDAGKHHKIIKKSSMKRCLAVASILGLRRILY
jgi:hypothetical protein